MSSRKEMAAERLGNMTNTVPLVSKQTGNPNELTDKPVMYNIV